MANLDVCGSALYEMENEHVWTWCSSVWEKEIGGIALLAQLLSPLTVGPSQRASCTGSNRPKLLLVRSSNL